MVLPRLVPVLAPKLAAALGAQSSYDGLLVIYSKLSSVLPATTAGAFKPLAQVVQDASKADASFGKGVSFVCSPDAPGSRIVFSATGSLHGDVDDVRRYSDAARAGLARTRAAGVKRPIVLLCGTPSTGASSVATARVKRDYAKFVEVTLLGLLAEAYQPLQTREHLRAQGKSEESFEEIGIAIEENSDEFAQQAVKFASAVEEGRRVAKDMGGADPERMTPLRAVEYVEAAFKGSDVSVTVMKDVDTIKKEYPMLHAVTRASLVVPRHFPAVVKLEYHSPEPSAVKENIFLIGKGVTYDTGGLDIKAGGHMRGMSRDKCGATACAGFLKTVSLLKPTHVNIVAELGFVRNSCGADGYVSDEIIVSRAGVRALIGNTDAEGRMVMVDLLAAAKERALEPKYASVPSHLFTVATLTGHAVRAVGPYAIALGNGASREHGIPDRLVKAGHVVGDPFELSTLRREDYEFIAPGSSTEDVVQANDLASTMTSRGHQFPAAFMAIASGIAPHHDLDSEKPISYTHLDIAGSAEEGGKGLSLPAVTGSPVAALVQAFLV